MADDDKISRIALTEKPSTKQTIEKGLHGAAILKPQLKPSSNGNGNTGGKND